MYRRQAGRRDNFALMFLVMRGKPSSSFLVTL
jgi:hypothetical protein